MKRETAQCAFRLLRGTNDLRPVDLAGHLRILRDFLEITMLIRMTYFIQNKFFNNLFEVVTPDCQE